VRLAGDGHVTVLGRLYLNHAGRYSLAGNHVATLGRSYNEGTDSLASKLIVGKNSVDGERHLLTLLNDPRSAADAPLLQRRSRDQAAPVERRDPEHHRDGEDHPPRHVAKRSARRGAGPFLTEAAQARAAWHADTRSRPGAGHL
jgi:hypothetical protein